MKVAVATLALFVCVSAYHAGSTYPNKVGYHYEQPSYHYGEHLDENYQGDYKYNTEYHNLYKDLFNFGLKSKQVPHQEPFESAHYPSDEKPYYYQDKDFTTYPHQEDAHKYGKRYAEDKYETVQDKQHHEYDKDVKFLKQKQQHVFELLKNIQNIAYNKEYFQIAKDFNFEQYAQYYKPDAYEYFMYLFKNEKFLPRGEIFNILNEQHLEQAVALFKLFYYAKDYSTFYKTAVWARQYFNEGMFLYSYSVAVAHRPDMRGVILPAIYEIYPQYFYNSEVIQKAQQYKMTYYNNYKQGNKHTDDVYTIFANYSGSYLNLHPEQSFSYYLEDVGLNAFYYYFNVYFPYWMDSQEFPQIQYRRGERYMYVHQQILARYYLERLSHGVGGFEYFNWDLPFQTGYYPSLTYPNGLAFPERPNYASLYEFFKNYGQKWCFSSKYGYAYSYINSFEQRILDAIDMGIVYDKQGNKVSLYTQEGLNILGNIIEGNADSVNLKYYGEYVNYAKTLLGYSKQPLNYLKVAPSALENYETSLRDPAFYQLFKRIVLIYQKYAMDLPKYNKKDLYYPGVKVENVEVSPLVTYYDIFTSDISNGLPVTAEEYENGYPRVQVQQYRLNHKQFDYKVIVDAEKATTATVKVFIGPKYDEHGRPINFNENYMNFVVLDKFVTELKSGQNIIKRNSMETPYYGHDHTTYYQMYKNIMTGSYAEDYAQSVYGFPQRFMIPRGSAGGMPFQFYVIVYPYAPVEYKDYGYHYVQKYHNIIYEKYPVAYPFDRPAKFENVYYVPNAYAKTVTIFHQEMSQDVLYHNYGSYGQNYYGKKDFEYSL